MTIIKDNAWPIIAFLFASLAFYVTAVANNTAASAVKEHATTKAPHPVLQERIATQDLNVGIIKNNLSHMRHEIDQVQKAQMEQVRLLQEINSKL